MAVNDQSKADSGPSNLLHQISPSQVFILIRRETAASKIILDYML
jgi:hypothetical protein